MVTQIGGKRLCANHLHPSTRPKRPINSNASIRQALSSPDAQQILKVLQSKDAARLQAAAQSALKGDSRALSGILGELAKNSDANKAMERLNHIMNKQ